MMSDDAEMAGLIAEMKFRQRIRRILRGLVELYGQDVHKCPWCGASEGDACDRECPLPDAIQELEHLDANVAPD